MKNMNQTSYTNTGANVTNAPKFFVDHKKGEVAELMNLLKNPSLDRDQAKKKDVIKRVIAYMTLGVDVSKLFYEMVKVISVLTSGLIHRRHRHKKNDFSLHC
jgi:vesicle coat complex subunit